MAGTPEVTVQLKPVQIRELRDGMWVAVAEDSEPLVVTEAVAKVLKGTSSPRLFGTRNAMTSSGVMRNGASAWTSTCSTRPWRVKSLA